MVTIPSYISHLSPSLLKQAGSIACVYEINSWMVSNKLKVNTGKTELTGPKRMTPPTSINRIHRPARNIGVTFDEHMSLDKHVTSTCKVCFFHLRNISKIRDCLSPADTEKLVHAFTTSKLEIAYSEARKAKAIKRAEMSSLTTSLEG